MFDFMKEKKAPSVIVAEPPKGKYSSDIEKIHNEFEIAGDKLVQEAKEILENAPKINKEKARLLEQFGFRSTKEVLDAHTVRVTTEKSNENMRLVNHYREAYPINKFITKDQVETICKKYNLVFGSVTLYTGFVPLKNLKEISNFTVKDKDCIYVRRYYGNERDVSYNEYQHHIMRDDSAKMDYKKKDNLLICAPIKNMNTKGLEVKNGFELIKKEIPDPVVLHEVQGGYLIVTKWGDEASDEMLIHDNHKDLISNQSSN